MAPDHVLGHVTPGRRENHLLALTPLDEPIGLEALQHLPDRGARDAEQLGHSGRQRRGLPRDRAVLPDRKREEVDRLEIDVDRMTLSHRRRFYPARTGRTRTTGAVSPFDAKPSYYSGLVARFASIYPLVTTRSLARPFTYAG